MILSSPPILSYAGEQTQAPRPPIAWIPRIAYACAGVLLPAVCFGMAIFGYPLKADWRSPDWSFKISILLDGLVPTPFYPLLAYSIISMALMVVQPVRWAKSLIVRIGLWTGVPLALQFTLIQAIAFAKGSDVLETSLVLAAAVVAGPASAFIVWAIALIPFGRMWRSSTVLAWIVWIIIVLCTLAGTVFLMLPSLLLAPAWAMAAYGCMSYQAAKLAKERPIFSVGSGVLTPLAWLGTFVAAWRISIELAIRAYAKLPPTAPQCYIATAAARGHSWVVLSKETRTLNGEVFCLNDQLRRLKAAEIAMATLLPNAHRIVRAIYDRLGKPAAGAIRHPILADLAYLMLKPAEWTAVVLLNLLPRRCT